jgi:putative solute:sodium symporter small subunit
MTTESDRVHWRRQLRLTFILLSVWFLVGPVMSILFVEQMNQLSVAGIPFGFWMAQQGSIYVFVALIFVYAWLSDRNDRAANEAHAEEGGPRAGHAGAVRREEARAPDHTGTDPA